MGDILQYLSDNSTDVAFYAQTHFLLVLYSVTIATVISLVLALVLHTNQLTPPSWSRSIRAGGQETSLLVASALLTVPSLALFGLLQPIFGYGIVPAIVGLTLYGIYPVLRNTVAGLSSVDPAVLEAARGIGMGPIRRITRIQLPLAWPVVLSGIRVSVLIMVSLAAVAAIVSGIGFGKPLLDGLTRLGGAGALPQVLVGTFAPLLVAAVFEIAFVIVKRLTTSRGIRV